jgi:SAM-dependent methyltransferase
MRIPKLLQPSPTTDTASDPIRLVSTPAPRRLRHRRLEATARTVAQMTGTAPDGSPVALYLKLPGDQEADVIASVAQPSAEVLELGCGAGRVTRGLVARGLHVTAVDNSAEMLAHVFGATTVLADITTLRLDREFDAVVLASHFVNEPDAAERVAYLATCRRHVRDTGRVVVERYAPGWVTTAVATRRERDGVVFDLHDVELVGNVLHATMTYELDGTSFHQPFSALDVDDERLAIDAANAGLVIENVCDDPAWVVLRRRP